MPRQEQMDPRLRRAIETQLEYMPSTICAFVLLLTFALAGGVLSVSIRAQEALPWSVLIFPGSGLLFAGGFQGLWELLRRMYSYAPSRATRKRELWVWLVSPLVGALAGVMMGLLHRPPT